MAMNRRVFLCALGAQAPLGVAFAQSAPDFGARLAAAASAQVGVTVLYDPAYVRLAYPLGDVAPDRGVCTDVVIRAYRALGHDLQALVHRDMRAAFGVYPKLWGLSRPDRNIDHRRVPNLETFLRRQGARLAPSRQVEDYQAGDIISWRLMGSGLAHIGLVAARENPMQRPKIIHNIGAGTRIEDILFEHPITDRFRWRP
jgi:uncharacterized protein